MSWGSSWGRRWGGGSESSARFALASAAPSAANALIVTFTKRPLFSSPLLPGDASALAYWTLARSDGSATHTPTLLLARNLTPDYTQVELVFAGAWAAAVAYTITVSDALLAADGFEHIEAPLSLDLVGAPVVLPGQQRTQQTLVDLARGRPAEGSFEGGLVVGADGDYAKHTGTAVVRKIIERSVFTAQGAFRHLADRDWGMGLTEKTAYNAGDLLTLDRRLRLALAANPEVLSSTSSVSLDASNMLLVRVRARTSYGDVDEQLRYGGA